MHACLNFIYDDRPFKINWIKILIRSGLDTMLSRVISTINTGEWPTDVPDNASKDALLKPYDLPKTYHD